jgi:signal transduction histidine kinase
VITKTAEACGAEAGALLFQSRDQTLTLYVVNTCDPEDVREVAVQYGEGIAGRAMMQNESLNIDDPDRIRDPGRVREMLGLDVHSALAAPLAAEGQRVCGAIALYNRQGDPPRFSDDDASLLLLVSANVSTELRVFEARKERERAEHLGSLGRLLSGVMHDLRTPLTIISGYVQLMEVTEDAEVRASHARTISEQFELISTMQHDLLAYARGERKVWIRKIILRRFFDQFREQIAADLRGNNIELSIDYDTRAVAFFDEAKMLRALNNLARNAVEAMMPGDGKLSLRCEERSDDIEFEVSDTGPGIPEEISDRLFEPFVTSGKVAGTGLGLSIVKQIVEEHDGSVDVTTSSTGTSFVIRLPHAMRPQSRRPPTVG